MRRESSSTVELEGTGKDGCLLWEDLLVPELPIDKRSPREFWDDQHRKLASDPLTWTLTADELLRAFELLAAQVTEDLKMRDELRHKYIPNVISTALMLSGFAIENMFKAIYVSQHPAFDRAGKFVVVTHDLISLADEVGLPLTIDERTLLECLEQFVTWAGRYPMPLYADDMRPRTLPFGGFAPRTYGWVDDDFRQIRSFAAKLRAKLPAITDGEPGNFTLASRSTGQE